MELKRKCEKDIRSWYRKSTKALLVKGARQVGKTHLIRRVLKEEGCDVFEVNLIETPIINKELDLGNHFLILLDLVNKDHGFPFLKSLSTYSRQTDH